MSTIKASTIQTSAGGAVTLTDLYPAKAWINWQNKTTNVLVASANVSSVADVQVGVFTTNFSTAFSAATYLCAGCSNTNNGTQVPAIGFGTSNGGNTYTTTSIGNAAEDVDAGYTDYINNTILYLA